MRIAILYICTGKYSLFWKDFFTSSEKYFAPRHEKEYFVFTDQKILHQENARVHHIEQAPLGWPDITLKRYHMFAGIQDCLRAFDCIFFFNANVRFCRVIGDTYLPDSEYPLVFQQHPGFYNKSCCMYPYERNMASQAFIPKTRGRHYLAGGINGGMRDDYLAMIEANIRAIDEDLRQGIVACWHDESHLNKYALGKPYKLWHPGFATPDGRNLPFPRMIRLVDKRSVGGHEYMRGVSELKPKTLKERFVFRPSFPHLPAKGDNPLVLARLLGGLGNQMFIYAAAYALAKRLGAELAIDSGALQSDKIRRYELYRFGLMDPQWRIPNGCDKLLGILFNLHARMGLRRWTYLKCPPAYTPSLEQACGNCYLTGYWQSPKYFDAYAEDVRKLFSCQLSSTPAVKELKNYVESRPTVAVHLRRGDYTSPKNLQKHGILPVEYYESAKARMEAFAPECQYLVFSDDQAEAKRIFSHWRHCRIAPPQDHIDDLMLMRRCHHAIIANSSFSWWGAWLGQREDQHVIAPRQWFARGSAVLFSVEDLFPLPWTVL